MLSLKKSNTSSLPKVDVKITLNSLPHKSFGVMSPSFKNFFFISSSDIAPQSNNSIGNVSLFANLFRKSVALYCGRVPKKRKKKKKRNHE